MTDYFHDKVVSIVRLLKIISPFLLIIITCTGVVKGSYMLMEHYLLQPPIFENVTTEEKTKNNGGDVEEPVPVEERNYAIILERNLFGSLPEKTIEEMVNDKDYTEDIELTNLDIVLFGTVQGTEGTSRAIIFDKTVNKQDLYEKGDVVQSASIEKILRGKVILSFNGRDQMLDMSGAAKMRAGGTSVAPPGKARPQAVVPQTRPVAVAPIRPSQRAVRGSVENAVRPRVIRPSRRIGTK